MLHRVKSGLWVAAYLRRVAGEARSAVVVRRGAEEAGAVFVKIARLDGTADLYGPAPQTAFAEDDEDRILDRLFEPLAEAAPEAEVDARLARERKFDPDLWVVEVEDRTGRHGLELVRRPPAGWPPG